MFIPWSITIQTKILPDAVCIKISELTDEKVDTFFGPWKANENVPASKTFGGKIDYGNHSFKLVNNPYSLSTYLWLKIIYHGKVSCNGGNCYINLWIRPSARGVFMLTMFITLNFILAKQISIHGWDMEWGKAVAVFAVVWSVFALNTITVVREARKTFRHYFESTTGILKP